MTGQFPELISKQFRCHTALFICPPAWPSPSKPFLGSRKKWSQSDGKKKEEHVGLPPLWICFLLDHPTPLEEEVIVRGKTKKGHLSHVVIIYPVPQRLPLLLHSVVIRVMEG